MFLGVLISMSGQKMKEFDFPLFATPLLILVDIPSQEGLVKGVVLFTSSK